MRKYVTEYKNMDEVVGAHGSWSAMAIRLGPDEYTKQDQADFRLRRILQVAADAVGKPLSDCRVLDLACLEGHYAIEFALHGSSAVGIELREANIEKAAFAVKKLGLDNIELYLDDVNNLSAEYYGTFDIIICSGILYHLRGEDACSLIGKISECCTGIMILDTFIAANYQKTIVLDGKEIHGSPYKEHNTNASKEERVADLWASVDNEESFWLTEESLLRVIQEAGFSSCAEVLMPAYTEAFDRRTYLAYRGAPVEVKSSEVTNAAALPDVKRRDPRNIHPSQKRRSIAFKVAKRILPQQIKDAIKPSLRRIGLLDAQESPFPTAKREPSNDGK